MGQAVGEQLGAHGHEQAVVAGSVIDEGIAEFGGHEGSVASHGESMAEELREFVA